MPRYFSPPSKYNPPNLTNISATEHYNFNRHIWDVLPSLYVPERKVTFSLYILYIISGGMIKISILLFYRRLDSRNITRTFRIATWINVIGIAGFVVAFTLVLFFSCNPSSAFWDQFDIQKTLDGYLYNCWVDESADLLAASIISAIQDAIAAFLPTILYWNLQIPRRQKVALGAIFALGYSVCIVACVRSYYVYRTFHNPRYDSTWESWPAWLLCMIEIQLGAICASAPALKVFLAHYFKVAATKIGSSRGGGSGFAKGGASWFRSSASKSTATKDGYLKEPGSRHTVDEEGGIVLHDWDSDFKTVQTKDSTCEDASVSRATSNTQTTMSQHDQTRIPGPERVGVALTTGPSRPHSLGLDRALGDWETRRQPRTQSMQTQADSLESFIHI
jgi:hypothetical protein